MGTYECVSSNGVPPAASKRVDLEVTFQPLIKIRQPMVGTTNGSWVVLECFVEAFPLAITYWQYGEKIIVNNWKYKSTQEEQTTPNYALIMTLNITYVEPSDYGIWSCVAKNERGKTRGVLTLYGE